MSDDRDDDHPEAKRSWADAEPGRDDEPGEEPADFVRRWEQQREKQWKRFEQAWRR